MDLETGTPAGTPAQINESTLNPDQYQEQEPQAGYDQPEVSTYQALLNEFPFPSIRPVQQDMLAVIARSHDERTRFTIIEAPTGCGKSPVGMATALYAKNHDDESGAYLLTSQNILLSQMMGDFKGYGLTSIKGKNNYKCHAHGKRFDCATGAMLNPQRKLCEVCPYKAAKQSFLLAPLGVTNYKYFLTETRFVGKLAPRGALVLDEAHNIEEEVLNMAHIEITPSRAEDFGIVLPRFATALRSKIVDWLVCTFVPAAKRKQVELAFDIAAEEARLARESKERAMLEAREKLELEAWEKLPPEDRPPFKPLVHKTYSPSRLPFLHKKLSGIINLLGNVAVYVDDQDGANWFAWSDKKTNVLAIRPLSAANACRDLLYRGQRSVILMSATLLDQRTVMRNIGIDPAEARLFSAPSDFPRENRRLVVWPSGNMGKRTIEQSLPGLIRNIEKILDKHDSEKGLIHTHTYRIAQAVAKHLSSTRHSFRIITHTNEPESREAAILQHTASEDPTILLSPSMCEGLDLKDDLSRFQIICKVPYPYLDPYTRERMNRDPNWYELRTALTLVQACGRSVRSNTDYAVTFILDSAFDNFYSNNQSILPDWWKAALEYR